MSDILTKALEEQDYLMHHGILGQKWGVRRYQNPDGSMTALGKARYLDENGYDTTKYSRKLGLIGGAIDLARNAKHQKDLRANKANTKSDSSDDYLNTAKEYSKSGWKVDNSGDFGGDVYATKDGTLGGHKITISSMADPGDVGGYAKDHVDGCDKAASAIVKNGSSVVKQSKNLIAKEIYDKTPSLRESMTRQEFMKSIKPEFMNVYGTGSFSDIATISFSANGMGGHSLDIEWDIKNNRPVRNDVSVNG